MTDCKFNVAIVGAGLGGLMLALSLHKSAANVRVDIYESAPQFTEIGAGIGMWPRVWELIKALGLEDQLLMIAGNTRHPETMHLRKSDHPEGFAYYTFNSNIDIMTFHRAELLTVLQSHLPPSFGVHFSKRLSTFDQPPSGSGPVNLHFQDGTSATCDVLIGCDGIKSAVRGCLYESLAAESETRGDSVQAAAFRNHVGPKWTGSLAYRGLLSRERLEQEYPGHRAIFSLMTYSGKNKRIITYPISQGQIVNVVALVMRPELEDTTYDGPLFAQVPPADVIKEFVGWEPEAVALLKCLNKVSCWTINTVKSLPTYVHRRVALAGDAAHAMAPHQASGAGQAFEDGYILAAILAHPSVTLESLPAALRLYDEIRRPFSQHVQQLSRQSGMTYDFSACGCEEYSEGGDIPLQKLEELGRVAEESLRWVVDTSAMDDRRRAVERLDAGMLSLDATSCLKKT